MRVRDWSHITGRVGRNFCRSVAFGRRRGVTISSRLSSATIDQSIVASPCAIYAISDVRLEGLGPEHAEIMFEGLSDPAAYRYIREDPPVSVEALRAHYIRQIEEAPVGEGEAWINWIVRRASDGAPLGYAQATVGEGEALLGYHVFPQYWRRGVGKAALTLALARSFEDPAIHCARVAICTRNIASLELARSVGFVFDRHVEHADFFKGEWSDEYELVFPRPVSTASRFEGVDTDN